jgi:hypothetical protein
MFRQPIETGPEIRAASAHWIESDLLTGCIDIDPVDTGIEVEHMDTLRPLSFEDGTDLRLEERE